MAPLGIAELWALPTMLRISVLEALVELSERLFLTPRADARFREPRNRSRRRRGRAIRALRLLAEIDWKTFFQKTSAVDALFGTDPAGVYSKMDFETRDAYRKVVEELAWTAECPEPEVASLAVALAGEQPDDPREGHVGYYLLDRGRARLEAQIGYRPRGKNRARRAVLEHPTLAYLGTIAAMTLAMLAGIGIWAAGQLGLGLSLLLCALALVPVSSIAVALANAWLTALLSPRTLPKLDFSEGIPEDCKTAIVIPALVATPADFDELLAGLELHFLSNPDPLLEFVLLTDHVDSDEIPDDEACLPTPEPRSTSSTRSMAKTARHRSICCIGSRAGTRPKRATWAGSASAESSRSSIASCVATKRRASSSSSASPRRSEQCASSSRSMRIHTCRSAPHSA